jgi:hypothetical protein
MTLDPSDSSPLRWPGFREYEVVRVVDVSGTGGPEGKERLLGTEGTVMAFSPDPENSGRWAICVWLPLADEGIDFWEDQLETTGLIEVDDDQGAFEGIGGERVSRLELTPTDPPEIWGDELGVQFLVPITNEPPKAIAARVEASLRALIPLDRIRWRGERHSEYEDCWELEFDLWPSDGSRKAFDQLVAAYNLWQERGDDGWEGFYCWWRTSAQPGEECFILPEAHSIFVIRTPWSDPIYRQVPAGRQPPKWPRIKQSNPSA